MTTQDKSIFKTYNIDITHQDDDGGEYRAFTHGNEKHQARIRVHYNSTTSELYSYANMKRVIVELPKVITLIFTGFSVTIEGTNLDKPVGDLQDEKIRHIRIYDPNKYPKQPEDGKPIITRIEYNELTPQE